MTLLKNMVRQGNVLFRHRSYLPLAFIPLLLVALRESEGLERLVGDTLEDAWEVFCVAVSFCGLLVRCLTVGFVPEGTSERNTACQVAVRLNTTGMYSVVRHPLYLGNFLVMIGMVMVVQVWWLVIVAVTVFWLYYERIMAAEERFLEEKFGDEFVTWAKRTPAFLPDLRRWRPPDRPFSWKMVLRREYTGLLVITLSFTFIEVVGDWVTEGYPDIYVGWMCFLGMGVVSYILLRTLKKHTHLLDVPTVEGG